MLRGALVVSTVLLAGAPAAFGEAPSPLGQPTASVVNAEALSELFRNAARKSLPSVVNIRTERVYPVDSDSGGRFERSRGERPMSEPVEGMATGVIVSTDGYILTNNHVVETDRGGRVSVFVTLADSREYPARIVGVDAPTDLAVLRISADNISPAVLGDSDRVQTGDWVIAAGNPFGLGHTVTAGIVSARGRHDISGDVSAYEDFIQTDAAINPGNSGGPMINLRGEVVGINTAITTRTGGSMGIGFAIPINMARTVFDAIVTEGRVVRGFLGVTIRDLTHDLAEAFGFTSLSGVLVDEAIEGTPAATADLRPDDIITSIDGVVVSNVFQLRSAIAAIRPGRTVTIELFRDGTPAEQSVCIGEVPGATTLASAAHEPDLRGLETLSVLGMTVASATDAALAAVGLDPRTAPRGGVVVVGVAPDSDAAAKGLTPGMMVLEVNRWRVNSLDGFERLVLDTGGGRLVRLRLRAADGAEFTEAVRLTP